MMLKAVLLVSLLFAVSVDSLSNRHAIRHMYSRRAPPSVVRDAVDVYREGVAEGRSQAGKTESEKEVVKAERKADTLKSVEEIRGRRLERQKHALDTAKEQAGQAVRAAKAPPSDTAKLDAQTSEMAAKLSGTEASLQSAAARDVQQVRAAIADKKSMTEDVKAEEEAVGESVESIAAKTAETKAKVAELRHKREMCQRPHTEGLEAGKLAQHEAEDELARRKEEEESEREMAMEEEE
ncbi:unnamed protein product [Vitrella brassicaformis CCMP3155]|uniref:Uncharacterized protein n=1 Tax=Vitrella brassicaformis (strain CCMP3155) TaxID=1169540 RepID=A0A0G4EJI7_VITBC|nr:unnamed protein product [Vitrella brassicaformis CCMP3155]|eukprot:CEL97196.1 unnamed protein product [Vitrella brassicaformis CCMP3155]